MPMERPIVKQKRGFADGYNNTFWIFMLDQLTRKLQHGDSNFGW
jgi:hypothetical protein